LLPNSNQNSISAAGWDWWWLPSSTRKFSQHAGGAQWASMARIVQSAVAAQMRKPFRRHARRECEPKNKGRAPANPASSGQTTYALNLVHCPGHNSSDVEPIGRSATASTDAKYVIHDSRHQVGVFVLERESARRHFPLEPLRVGCAIAQVPMVIE